MRLTVGQATVRFLSAQYTERDGVEHQLFEGCFGISATGELFAFSPHTASRARFQVRKHCLPR